MSEDVCNVRTAPVFSLPSKGASLPSAKRSRGGPELPCAKQFASAYESAARLRNDFELSEEQRDLPTVTRTSPTPSTGPASKRPISIPESPCAASWLPSDPFKP